MVIHPVEKKISHNSKCLFIGSCFSDNISKKLEEGGLEVVSNPYGTLFHPLAIFNLFEDIDIESTCFQRDDLWFSWLSSGTVFAMSKIELVQQIENLKSSLISYLETADFLFFTFGTAIGYRLKSTNQLVANCHKMPITLFEKELTDSVDMILLWSNLIDKLKSINPRLEIVFTVSPVRHIKEGVVENNVSKAQLFSLIHSLKGNYFPSYEIVNDELRDYRFFKEDLVHPNDIAIKYVWDKFLNTYIHSSSKELIDDVIQVRRMLEHKTLYSDSNESKKFQAKLKDKKSKINKLLPNIKW